MRPLSVVPRSGRYLSFTERAEICVVEGLAARGAGTAAAAETDETTGAARVGEATTPAATNAPATTPATPATTRRPRQPLTRTPMPPDRREPNRPRMTTPNHTATNSDSAEQPKG